MKKNQLEDKLKNIKDMIDEHLARKPPMLVSSLELLNAIKTIITEEEMEPVQEDVHPASAGHVIISCDASIKKNPGGPSSIGVVIQHPGQQEPLKISQIVKATTNNEAEYDAVYFGLMSLSNLSNNPGTTVEVRSDSLLVIDQLKGTKACRNEKLERRRKLILELAEGLPFPVEWVWRPRNSTPELKEANYLAQDLLEVPRH